jgi:hypothetical protein
VAERNQVILGTDSRTMTQDFSGVFSNTSQKLFGVAPKTFIATSGWLLVSEFQRDRAQELAGELGADIRTIGERLARETIPRLMELAEMLRPLPDPHNQIGQSLSGSAMLHCDLLIGQTAGKRFGYTKRTYRLLDGQVTIEQGEFFDSNQRGIYISCREPGAGIAQDPSIWTGRPVWVVRRILAALKAACPSIGGPDQIVQLDRAGARWISRPLMEAIA